MNSPGYYYATLLDKMPLESVCQMLHENDRSLVDSMGVVPERRKKVAISLLDIKEVLKDAGHVQALLDFLPAEKHKELSMRAEEGILENEYQLSAGFFSSAKRRKVLCEFLGVRATDDTDSVSVPAIQEVKPEYPVYPYQRRVVQEVNQRLPKFPYRTVIHMPTGSGKTRTAMYIVARHLFEHGPTTVLWLASSTELLEQAAETFSKAGGFLGSSSCDIVRCYGKKTLGLKENRGNTFLVAGLQKINSMANKDSSLVPFLGKHTSLIVFDEAHQAIAPSYSSLVNSVCMQGKQDMAVLGLTATPGRTTDEASEKLAEFFHRSKVTIEVENGDTVEYLIREGYIARPHFKRIEYGVRIIGDSPQEYEYLEEDLLLLGKDNDRNQIILNAAIDLLKRHRRTIIFSPSVSHARVLASVLSEDENEYVAYAVTSKTPSGERKRVIDEFLKSDSRHKAICNFGVLTTGFDAPSTSAILIARPTKSLVLYSQMIGRAIRGELSGGNKEAEILTVVDTTLPGFCSVAESFNYWEEGFDA